MRVSTVTRLEIVYSARTGDELRAGLRRPPLASMPVESSTPAIEDRAVEVQQLLDDRGHHRAAAVPDLLIAATAELAGLVVLHRDKDFDLIAGVSDQQLEQLRLDEEPTTGVSTWLGNRLSASEPGRFDRAGPLARRRDDEVEAGTLRGSRRRS